MTDLKSARELIARARVDLAALEELADNPRVADEIFGFLAQQAVEKTLKAWLALLGRQYPVTHNLDQLARVLQEAGVRLPSKDLYTELNPYAVQFRYESIDESEPDLDRRKMLKAVASLVAKVGPLLVKREDEGPMVRESSTAYRVRPAVRRGKPKAGSKGKKTVRRR